MIFVTYRATNIAAFRINLVLISTRQYTVAKGRPISPKNQLYVFRTSWYVCNALLSSRSKEYISFMRNSRPLNNPARGRFSSRNLRANVTLSYNDITYLIHPYWKRPPTL